MLIDDLKEFIEVNINKTNKYEGLLHKHLSIVLAHCLHINKDYNFDEETLTIAALSHDIGKIINNDGDNHAEEGMKIMKDWLKVRDYNKNLTFIFAGIKWHGGVNDNNIDEFMKMDEKHQNFCKILMTADGLAHIDMSMDLLNKFLLKLTPKEACKKLVKKLNREWNEKIILNKSKREYINIYKLIMKKFI